MAFRFVLEIVFHLVGYCVGRVVVAVVTLGRVQCERFSDPPPRRRQRASAHLYRRGPLIHLSAEMTALAGLLAIGLAVAGFFLIRRLTA